MIESQPTETSVAPQPKPSSTSAARIAANRANAARSTGPRTTEGKAVSRLNAFRHALAGAGDLIGPDEAMDLDLVEERTQAFVRELKAPGVVGRIMAHRAAVLSIRLERASLREFVLVETAVRAARVEFDVARQTAREGWIEALTGPGSPREALQALEAEPEGIEYLIGAWQNLRTAVDAGSPSATSQALRWLSAAGTDPALDLVDRINAEVARLQTRAGSAEIEANARITAIDRDEVGLIAGFDSSPEGSQARRYETDAERGIFRAIRAITDLRRAQNLDPVPVPVPVPTVSQLKATIAALRAVPIATPTPVQPPPPPVSNPPAVSLASFRVGVAPPVLTSSAAYFAAQQPPMTLPTPPKKRRDVRKPVRGRR